MYGEKGFYSPLDRSQISFLPMDLDSIDETDSISGEVRVEKAVFSQSSSGASIATSGMNTIRMESSQSIFSEAHPNSIRSREDEMEKLSSLLSVSSHDTNMSQDLRYKIVLNFSPREVKLIRESWSTILNNEAPGNKLTNSIRKLIRDFGLATSKSLGSDGRSSSAGSIRSVVTTLGNKMRGGGSSPAPQPANTSAFASSHFCEQAYMNLLIMDPDLQIRFPSIKHQSIAFAGVLTMAINNLENLPALESYLTHLGKRHARIIGIQRMDFDMMGDAFLKTIRHRFGSFSSVELEEIWSRLYSYLANSMLQFGIDPILKIDYDQNVIVFPVPDLIKNTPTTVSPFEPSLESNTLQDDNTAIHSVASKHPTILEKATEIPPSHLSTSHSREPYMFSVRRGGPNRGQRKDTKSSFNGLTKRVSIARLLGGN